MAATALLNALAQGVFIGNRGHVLTLLKGGTEAALIGKACPVGDLTDG